MQKPNFQNNEQISQILRVNHAGEYGAKRIYTGQLDQIKSSQDYKKIEHMYEQELVHLEYFENKLHGAKVRPTLLMPLWHCFGYFIGAVTARMGTKSAMICTESVEEVIDKHYEEQKIELQNLPHEKELLETISKFQAEELEHKETASGYTENMSFKDRLLSSVIKSICRVAIFVSKRV